MEIKLTSSYLPFAGEGGTGKELAEHGKSMSTYAHMHAERKGGTHMANTARCKHIPSLHLNITLVFTPKNNIFTLSHSAGGLIQWIEADNTDLQKSGAPPFTNVR